MKKTLYFGIVFVLAFQMTLELFAGKEKVNSRGNIEAAERFLDKVESFLKEDVLDEAEINWQKAYSLINETYNDRRKYREEPLEQLKEDRAKVEARLRSTREQIDCGIIQLKIRHDQGDEAMAYITETLQSDFYRGVGLFYMGNSYYHTGQFFLEEKDYPHAAECYSLALGCIEKLTSSPWNNEEEMKKAEALLDLLADSLFDLYILQEDFTKAFELLPLILKYEKNCNSEDSERFLKYKEIQENFPMYILSTYAETHSPQEAFELFCQLLQSDYGKSLSKTQIVQYYSQAAKFFEAKAEAELVTECEKKQMEISETALEEGSLRKSEEEELSENYEELLKKNLEKAEKAKDYKSVYEYKKKALHDIKVRKGLEDPLFRTECFQGMAYFLNAGERDYAKDFFDEYFQAREQKKVASLAHKKNLLPFTLVIFNLEECAKEFNHRQHFLYERSRQNRETIRCAAFAPQGNLEKEFGFYKAWYEFLKNEKKSGDDTRKLADELLEMAKDPVFQQIEYAAPILRLGTWFHKVQANKEATFCADYAENIVSFYKDSDSPENIFPIILKAALQKSADNSEKAGEQMKRLISDGIIQREIRSPLVGVDSSIMEQWPFEKKDSSMTTDFLYLVNTAKQLPENDLRKWITFYESNTNPVPLLLTLANEYEKTEQYTQALLVYDFVGQFFDESSEVSLILQKQKNTLEKKLIQ